MLLGTSVSSIVGSRGSRKRRGTRKALYSTSREIRRAQMNRRKQGRKGQPVEEKEGTHAVNEGSGECVRNMYVFPDNSRANLKRESDDEDFVFWHGHPVKIVSGLSDYFLFCLGVHFRYCPSIQKSGSSSIRQVIPGPDPHFREGL